MDRIMRIEIMEEKLNAATAAVRELERALEGYLDVQEDILALEEYLSGDERRGVLSEDGIYGLLEENGELRGRMKTLF